ncbi:MAG: monovalent cation/H+ antiporter complex subunit F [Vicinamibacterales bacterium]
MAEFFTIAIVAILVAGLGGLLHVARAQRTVDAMLAAQLLGTTLVAILLLAAPAWEVPALRDVALLVALLGAVTIVAMVSSSTGERA